MHDVGTVAFSYITMNSYCMLILRMFKKPEKLMGKYSTHILSHVKLVRAL